MKRQWTIQRMIVKRLDGQRRWDLAYQGLLQWANEVAEVANDSPIEISPEEVEDESRLVRSCLNLTATTEPNH